MMLLTFAFVLVTVCLAQPPIGYAQGNSENSLGNHNMGDLGRFGKWHEIEIALTGPDSQGRGNPNPFEIYVDVTFTSPAGKKYQIPGFYNGDGQGGLDGRIWMARFSADEM